MFDFEACPKVVAIVGSRAFSRLDWVRTFVTKLPTNRIIVSGGALGVDTMARKCAVIHKHHYKPFHIEDFEWSLLGRSVGQFRNTQLVDYVKRWNGTVVIFADKLSNGLLTPGSQGVKNYCEKQGVPYTVFSPEIIR